MFNTIFSDWMEWIEKPATNDEIRKGIKKVKTYFLVFFFITIAVVLAGIGMINGAGHSKERLIGLFIAIAGLSGNCIIKIWAHIKISNAKILWEMNKHFDNNIEMELKRSQAKDL